MEKQTAEKESNLESKVDPSLKRVIFVCTGNSARSQMAEAIVNARLGSTWKAYSAGTQPADHVHPLAIQVLKEIGIEHEGRTKTVDGFYGCDFDLVVTVCDAAAEKCPIWLGKGKRVHMGFPDPAKETGSQEHIMEVFRQVRDDIARKIPELLSLYK
ncbi:MAG: arsenate reductase ArsC [Chloroflexi bacterium]|nr:arsenate reductase ArsC [Chloroflexota bacterium]